MANTNKGLALLGIGGGLAAVLLLARRKPTEAAPEPTVPAPEQNLPLGADQVAVSRLVALGGIRIGDIEITDASMLPLQLQLGAGYYVAFSLMNLSSRETVGVQAEVVLHERRAGNNVLVYPPGTQIRIYDPITNNKVQLGPGESVSASGIVTITRRYDDVPGFPRLAINVLDSVNNSWRAIAIGEVP